MNNFDKFLNKIYIKHSEFIDHTTKYILKEYPDKYGFVTKKQKYDVKTIITEIIYFIKSSVSYDNYRGPINCKTLNKHILFFSKERIFERIYSDLLSKYLKNNKYSKLKYQSIDSSFILNKNGKQKLGRSVLMKNKNCYKLSIIADTNGIPNSIILDSGNKSDINLAKENLNSIKSNTNNKSLKPYLLGDKGYDSSKLKQLYHQNGYKTIIDFNKRNTKNKKLLHKFTKKQKKIFNKRIKVENSFALLKKYRRLQTIYDSYFSTFYSFINLGFCLLIMKFI